MTAKTDTDVDANEFRYVIPARLWFQHPNTVLRNATIRARKAGKRAAGKPDEEVVVLVWRQNRGAESAA